MITLENLETTEMYKGEKKYQPQSHHRENSC